MTDDWRDSGVHEFKREIPEEEEEFVVSSEDEVIPEEAVVPGGVLPGGDVLPNVEPAQTLTQRTTPFLIQKTTQPFNHLGWQKQFKEAKWPLSRWTRWSYVYGSSKPSSNSVWMDPSPNRCGSSFQRRICGSYLDQRTKSHGS